MTEYPVQLEVRSPDHFDRIQLVLRLVLMVVLGWFGATAGWLACLLYAALPLAAATIISSEGRDAYAGEVGPQLWRVLRWLLELSAYMMLLSDRFPTADGDSVRVDIRFTSRPTIGSALGRLVTSIPSALLLCVLLPISSVFCVVAIVFVLVGTPMPPAILAFQRGVLRWQARLVAYHASLVDEYPPFSFETNGGDRAATTAAR